MPFRPSALRALLGVFIVTLAPSAAWPQTDPAALSGVVIDDVKATFTGEWKSSTSIKPFLGESYRHDLNTGKGDKSALFTFSVEETGQYAVLLAYTPAANRDKAVPISIESADGLKTLAVDQTQPPALSSGFHPLGTFRFEKGTPGKVRIETKGTTATIIVDGIRLLTETQLALGEEIRKGSAEKNRGRQEKCREETRSAQTRRPGLQTADRGKSVQPHHRLRSGYPVRGAIRPNGTFAFGG